MIRCTLTHLFPSKINTGHLIQSFDMRLKKFPQLAHDLRVYRRVSSTLAWCKASAVECNLHPWVCLVPTLIEAHTIEATTFAEIEKVLGDYVPQTEKFFDFTQFFGWICDKFLGTKEVELIDREVLKPPCQMNIVH